MTTSACMRQRSASVSSSVSWASAKTSSASCAPPTQAGLSAVEDDAAFACLDFMALRVPVIAERTPLTQHFVAHGITGLLLVAGDPSLLTRVVGRRVFLGGDEAHCDGQRWTHARAAENSPKRRR